MEASSRVAASIRLRVPVGARVLEAATAMRLLQRLRETKSSDDPIANALVELANYCEKLSEKIEALDKVSDDDIKGDVRRLKTDVEGLERSVSSLTGDVRQLERGK